jgi:hypothetical protein
MKTILTAVFAFMAFSVSAGKNEQPSANKEIAIEGTFQKVTVGNDIKLVLVPAGEKASVIIAGKETAVNNVTVKLDKNELKIASKKAVRSGSVVVYLPARGLSFIELKNGASVSGQGTLKINNLTVLANTDTQVDLKVIGNLHVRSADDCDFIYQTNEVEKVVYVKQ